MGGYTMTTHRVVTRRGTIWLGQTCNIRCYFCYFLDKIETREHAEHPFMSLTKAKAMARTMVETYGNNSVDIQGGEPTIYAGIFDLIRYCREIALKPTLITNGIVLAKKERCQMFKDAGVYDFLFSVQGLGFTYDEIVGLPGGGAKLLKALENLAEMGIPFRFNCVLTKPVLSQLDAIADLAFRTGARAMNFIAFNPFVDQSRGGKRSARNVPTYTEIVRDLAPVLDRFDANGVEVNVRYLPFCLFEERHRKFVQTFQQILYDLHEWDPASESWTAMVESREAARPLAPPQKLADVVWQRRLEWIRRRFPHPKAVGALNRLDQKAREIGGGAAVSAWGERLLKWTRENVFRVERLSDDEALKREARLFMPRVVHPYAKSNACDRCAVSPICDGYHKDYGEIFGVDEFRAVQLRRRVTDPIHYTRHQLKVVEDEDADWALPPEMSRQPAAAPVVTLPAANPVTSVRLGTQTVP